VDVHDLINIPGAGNAEKQLRKAGMWRKGALELLWSIPDDDCPPRVNEKIDKAIELLEAMEAKE
jgi:hypothetical protein